MKENKFFIYIYTFKIRNHFKMQNKNDQKYNFSVGFHFLLDNI